MSDMVKSKLKKLKMNKAPGVDSVGTRMLLEWNCQRRFQTLLLNTKTLDSEDVPLDWKLVNVSNF